MISMFINQNVLINFMLKSLGFESYKKKKGLLASELSLIKSNIL